MRLKRKPWSEKVLSEAGERLITSETIEGEVFSSFLNRDNLCLEIGCGKGDFAVKMALKFPELNFIAVEIQSVALAYALKKTQEGEIGNLLFVNIDAHDLVSHLKERSVQTLFLNFSDPWPKKRQHKRRLTYPSLLNAYDGILAEGGKLIFKTDNEALFADTLEYLKDSPFVAETIDYDYRGEDPFDAESEYERKFRNAGIRIRRLVAAKRKEEKR